MEAYIYVFLFGKPLVKWASPKYPKMNQFVMNTSWVEIYFPIPLGTTFYFKEYLYAKLAFPIMRLASRHPKAIKTWPKHIGDTTKTMGQDGKWLVFPLWALLDLTTR